jgi:predicted dehydrogenase
MSKKIIKVGIVGAGARGIGCFGKLLGETSGVQITCLCDNNPVRMECGSRRLAGEQRLYTKPEEMFKEEELDAVVITSPDFLHEEHAVAALRSGVNVLIDKPLATTVKGCVNIIQAAEKSNKTVMIGFNLRHDPTLKKLKAIIDDGILGNIFLIENREFYDGGKTYMSRWNRKREWSGGLWIHKGSHDFDVFQWLLGFPKPVKVSAVAGLNVLNPQHIPFDLRKGEKVGPTCHECAYRESCPDVAIYDAGKHPEWSDEARECDGYSKDLCMYMSDKDVHDNGIAIVEYDNGARASHMECFITPICDRLYTVIGDKGQAEVSLHERTITVRPRWSNDVTIHKIAEVKGGHGGADAGLVHSFLEFIRGNGATSSTAEHGMWSTAVGEAAEIACRESRTVFVNELMKTACSPSGEEHND